MGFAAAPLATKLAIGSGVAQAGLSIAGQKASAKAQATAQARSSKAEVERYRQQANAARISQRFRLEQEAQQLQSASIQAMKARASARMAAGDAGVAGNSVEALLNDFSRQEATYRFGLTRQSGQRDIATNLQLKDMNQQSYNTLLQINQPIEQPDYAGAIFGAASTGLSIYSGVKKPTV
jgi:uncharacterized protein YlxW (UPF0749 family)